MHFNDQILDSSVVKTQKLVWMLPNEHCLGFIFYTFNAVILL